MNGVPVAPHGLILGEDGATASGKLSKHLQAPFPPAWDPKITKNAENQISGKTYIKNTPHSLWFAFGFLA